MNGGLLMKISSRFFPTLFRSRKRAIFYFSGTPDRFRAAQLCAAGTDPPAPWLCADPLFVRWLGGEWLDSRRGRCAPRGSVIPAHWVRREKLIRRHRVRVFNSVIFSSGDKTAGVRGVKVVEGILPLHSSCSLWI